MSFVSSSCLANAGLYRNTIEMMMYGPPETKETKKEFHDETLAKIKKVSKLKERFESGKLDLTLDESVVKEPLEKLSNKFEEVDVCDLPVFLESAPPTPKTRTKFAQATPQALNRGIMGCFERKTRCDAVETPILRSTPVVTSETKRFGVISQAMDIPMRSSAKRLDFLSNDIKLIETPIMTSTPLDTPEKKHPGISSQSMETRFSAKRLEFPSKPIEPVETPILRTKSRRVSGVSLIDSYLAQMKKEEGANSENFAPQKNHIEHPRQKTYSSGSSGYFDSMETPQHSCAKRLDYPSKTTQPVETSTMSYGESGISLIDARIAEMKTQLATSVQHYPAETKYVEHPRQKTYSYGSSGSSDSCGISGSTPKQFSGKRFDYSFKSTQLIETPILQAQSRQISGTSFNDSNLARMRNWEPASVQHSPVKTNYVEHQYQKTHSSGSSGSSDSCGYSDSMHTPKKYSAKCTAELIETPILRTASRQVSGISFNDFNLDEMRTWEPASVQHHPTKTNYVEHPRQKTHSSGSSGSSDSCGTSASMGTPKSVKKNESPASFNTRNRDYHSKLARAQVHNKFSMYYNWSSGSIRGIAIAVSRMRLKILKTIPEQCRDERIDHMITIYENCFKGVNKELDAVCCALFDLVDDVYETALSAHEEYVATKYRKKFDQLYA